MRIQQLLLEDRRTNRQVYDRSRSESLNDKDRFSKRSRELKVDVRLSMLITQRIGKLGYARKGVD